jgi:hypothetical protein
LGFNQRYFAAPFVFPGDFDGGEHVYRVHPINVQLQLLTYPVIMPDKEVSCIVMLKDDEIFAVAERAER